MGATRVRTPGTAGRGSNWLGHRRTIRYRQGRTLLSFIRVGLDHFDLYGGRMDYVDECPLLTQSGHDNCLISQNLDGGPRGRLKSARSLTPLVRVRAKKLDDPAIIRQPDE